MSGPIVRKYGFPNFEKIFGERPLEHGVDEEEQSADQPERRGSANRQEDDGQDKRARSRRKSRGRSRSRNGITLGAACAVRIEKLRVSLDVHGFT